MVQAWITAGVANSIAMMEDSHDMTLIDRPGRAIGTETEVVLVVRGSERTCDFDSFQQDTLSNTQTIAKWRGPTPQR